VMDDKIEDDIRYYEHKDCNYDDINHVAVLTRITINSSLPALARKDIGYLKTSFLLIT